MTPTRPTVVAFVGVRATGKSTVARALAHRLDWPVLDTDDRIAARVGQPVGAFLAEAGEEAFRRVEEEVCLDTLGSGDPGARVVALGGGAVISAAVRAALRRPGVLTVWLEAPVASLVERLRTSAIQRPPLTDRSLEEEVAHLLETRRGLHQEVAHLQINTSTSNVDASVAAIFAKMDEVLEEPPR